MLGASTFIGILMPPLCVDGKVGQSYDSDKDGSLEFDEFVQMRLEWVPWPPSMTHPQGFEAKDKMRLETSSAA